MAEAAAVISLVASIASLVDLGAKIVSRINEFADHTSEIPKSFRSLADRLPLLNQTLQSIQTRARNDQVQESIAKDLDRLVRSILDQVSFLQGCLDNNILPRANVSRLEKARKALQSLAKDEKVERAVEKIHNGIDVLVLHQTTNLVDVSDQILQEVARLNLQNSSSHQTFGLCLGQAPQIEPDAFIGRKAEIQQLAEWLLPEHHPLTQKVVSIVGMGGLGKTQLSLAFARQYAHRYKSIFWINAKDELSLRQSMSALSEVIFAESAVIANGAGDEQSQVNKVQRWLSEEWNSQWLLIFDNYDDPTLPNIRSPTGFDIRSFFPYRAQSYILITTRSPKLTFSQRLMLRKFEDIDSGFAVLSQRAGRDLSSDVDAQRLAVRLDGLPLTLATAGVYLSQTGISCTEYLQLYETAWNDLCGPDSEELFEYQDRTLSSTWIVSFEQVQRLDTDAAELFQFLAYFSNKDLWFDLFNNNSGGEPPWKTRVTANNIQFNHAMMRLQDYSLIVGAAGSYSLHPCVHDWISEHFELDRDNFVTALNCIVSNIPYDNNDLEYWKITRRVLPHINRLMEERFQKLWEASMLNEEFLSICHTVANLYTDWGILDLGEKIYERALAGKELVLGHDSESTLAIINDLGISYTNQGKYEQAEAMYKRVLSGYQDTPRDNLSTKLSAEHNLGRVYLDQNKLDLAEQMYEQALAGKEELFGSDNIRTLVTLRGYASVHLQKGNFDQAEQMFARALAGFEKAVGQYHVSTLNAITDLGFLYREQAKLDQALLMLERALAGFEEAVGYDHRNTFGVIYVIGLVYYDQGKLDQAKEMYMRAFDGFKTHSGLDHPDTKVVINSLKLVEAKIKANNK